MRIKSLSLAAGSGHYGALRNVLIIFRKIFGWKWSEVVGRSSEDLRWIFGGMGGSSGVIGGSSGMVGSGIGTKEHVRRNC